MVEILDEMEDLVTKSHSLVSHFALRRSPSTDDENEKLLIDDNWDTRIIRSSIATAAGTETRINESSSSESLSDEDPLQPSSTSFACQGQNRHFRFLGMDIFVQPVDGKDVGEEPPESLDVQTQAPTQRLRRSVSWPERASSSVYTFRYQRLYSW